MLIAIKAARQVSSRTLIGQNFLVPIYHGNPDISSLKERELGGCFLLLESFHDILTLDGSSTLLDEAHYFLR